MKKTFLSISATIILIVSMFYMSNQGKTCKWRVDSTGYC